MVESLKIVFVCIVSAIFYGTVHDQDTPAARRGKRGEVTAEYVNGVLEITAPIAAAALPRKIEVKTAVPFAKQIAA